MKFRKWTKNNCRNKVKSMENKIQWNKCRLHLMQCNSSKCVCINRSICTWTMKVCVCGNLCVYFCVTFDWDAFWSNWKEDERKSHRSWCLKALSFELLETNMCCMFLNIHHGSLSTNWYFFLIICLIDYGWMSFVIFR